MLGIWYEYAGVRRGRSGEGKGIRWNWDGIRLREARWVLRTEIGAWEALDTGKWKIEHTDDQGVRDKGGAQRADHQRFLINLVVPESGQPH